MSVTGNKKINRVSLVYFRTADRHAKLHGRIKSGDRGSGPLLENYKDIGFCSKAVLLLWIFYIFVLSCVCCAFVRVCLYVLCGHLLGKG